MKRNIWYREQQKWKAEMNFEPLTDKQAAEMVLTPLLRRQTYPTVDGRGQNRHCHVPSTVSRMQWCCNQYLTPWIKLCYSVSYKNVVDVDANISVRTWLRKKIASTECRRSQLLMTETRMNYRPTEYYANDIEDSDRDSTPSWLFMWLVALLLEQRIYNDRYIWR